MLSNWLTKRKLEKHIKSNLKKTYGDRRFYKIAFVKKVLEDTNLEDALNNIPFACFCYEEDYNKYFKLNKKKSDYRAIREKYGYKVKPKLKKGDSSKTINHINFP